MTIFGIHNLWTAQKRMLIIHKADLVDFLYTVYTIHSIKVGSFAWRSQRKAADFIQFMIRKNFSFLVSC